jgi:hypothetical protein
MASTSALGMTTEEASWEHLALDLQSMCLASPPPWNVTEHGFGKYEHSSSPLGVLLLPYGSVPSDQLPQLVHRAATSLAGCPAWQRKPEPWISLLSEGPAQQVSFSPQQRVQLLQALAPLGGPHVIGFQLGIRGSDVTVGDQELLALASSLGRGLTQLHLSFCTLPAQFWRALDGAFPALSVLRLSAGVSCSQTHMIFFCTRRASSNMHLQLSSELWESCDAQQLVAELESIKACLQVTHEA